MPEFIRILNKESWVFVISRCALAVVLGLLSWPVTIWLVDLYDLYSPILEEDSLRWLILASSVSLLFLIILVVRACMRKPNPSEIAEEVEKGNPQLRDLLNCAVEINQKVQDRKSLLHGKKGLGDHGKRNSFNRMGQRNPSGIFILDIGSTRYRSGCRIGGMGLREKSGAKGF
jgi:hypothetical protein